MEHICNEEDYMRRAIELAKLAADLGDVPVGSVIVKDGKIISEAYNKRECNKMATAHAELLAIEQACKKLNSWRLNGCTLYVTLEPCPMCAGAIINSRVDRVVYGAKDAVSGCCTTVLNINSYPFNHSFSVTGGVCEEECKEILKKFFKNKR